MGGQSISSAESTMASHFTVLVLLVGTYASAEEIPGNCSYNMDHVLTRVNQFLTEKGMGAVAVPGIHKKNVSTAPGLLFGINSLEMAEECSVTDRDDGSTMYSMQLSLGLFVLSYEKVTVTNQRHTMPSLLNIGKNTIRLSYSHYKDPCDVKLGDLRVTMLDDIRLYTTIRERNNVDVTQSSVEAVKVVVNKYLQVNRQELEKELEYAYCYAQ